MTVNAANAGVVESMMTSGGSPSQHASSRVGSWLARRHPAVQSPAFVALIVAMFHGI